MPGIVTAGSSALKIHNLLIMALLLYPAVAGAKTPELPQKVPVPKVHAPPAGNILPEKLGDTPIPEERPHRKGDTSEPEAEKTAPATAPVPPENPKDDAAKDEKPVPPADAPKPGEKPADTDKPDGKPTEPEEKKAEPEYLPDPRSNAPRPAIMPAEEKACRMRLKELGVDFEDHAPESDPAGCAMPWPLTVKSLGKDIDIAPDALMNCALAETSAKFARDVISPAAKVAYGEELKSISQASAYVCRPRNGTKKLSEHAFGNALDIARFTLSKGTEIDVEPAPDDKAAKFLAEIRKAACGPFKTVLGPGSDADHSLHFHFDLAPRKHGGTFCQ